MQFFAFKPVVSWLCIYMNICSLLQFIKQYNVRC
nr:MAG TPA: hypothetical protein [Caudoviricetes sp.]